jgi:hypothetical protein
MSRFSPPVRAFLRAISRARRRTSRACAA